MRNHNLIGLLACLALIGAASGDHQLAFAGRDVGIERGATGNEVTASWTATDADSGTVVVSQGRSTSASGTKVGSGRGSDNNPRTKKVRSVAPAEIWVDGTNGSDTNDGSQTSPLLTIQQALEQTTANTIIWIENGTYDENLKSRTPGVSGGPIVLRAVDPHQVTIRGGGNSRTFELEHDYYTVRDLVFDGLWNPANPGLETSYRQKAVYVVPQDGSGADLTDGSRYLQGIKLLNLDVKNYLDEALRLRFVQDAEVGYIRVRDVGRSDLQFGGTGYNGEGVYIGTSPTQLTGTVVDESTFDVHHIDVAGYSSEGVNSKEGTSGTIRYVTVTDADQATVGGVNVQGDNTIIEYVHSYDNSGSGIRVGESTARRDGVSAGINNTIRHNRVDTNGAYGLKIVSNPQEEVCGTDGSGNASRLVTGTTEVDATDACSVPETDGGRGYIWDGTETTNYSYRDSV